MKKVNNKFIIFIKKYWGILIFLTIFVIILFVNFKSNYFLLTNDNYSPELNAELTISRSFLSPSWRGYRGLGIASDSEQVDGIRAVVYFIGDLFLSKTVISQLFYFTSLFIGAFFAGKLVQYLRKKVLDENQQQLTFLSGSLIYLTTLWTVWVFYQGTAPFIYNYGMFPLLLYSILRYLYEPSRKSLFLLFVISVLSSVTAIIATSYIINGVFIIFFIIIFSFVQKISIKEKFIKLFKTFLIILTTQLFWILPFIFYVFNNSQAITFSEVNKVVTSSVIDLERSTQTLSNTSRFFTRTVNSAESSNVEFQRYSDGYYEAVGWLPILFSLIFIPIAIVKKKFSFLFLYLIGIGTIFFIKVDNPPFGDLFIWFQDNILLFKQALRWPSSKLYNIYLLIISITGTLGLVSFVQFLKNTFKEGFARYVTLFVFTGLIVSVTFAYSSYLFSGDLIPESSYVQIPEEYFHLEEYLEENDYNGRIYYAPPSNNNYFRSYKWGFEGSQFISYIIENPILDLSTAVGSEYTEDALYKFSDSFRAGDRESFDNLLNQYDVEYVLVDKSIVEEGFGFNIDWSVLEELFSRKSLLWQENELSLYKTNLVESLTYTKTIMNNDLIKGDQFVSLHMNDPDEMQPLNLLSLNSSLLESNGLYSTFVYEGEDILVVNNIAEDNKWETFPTNVILSGNTITTIPSYPKVVQEFGTLPFRKYLLSENYDFYSVNNFIYSKVELKKGVTIENEFQEGLQIYGVSDELFDSYNVTENLLDGKVGDCSGVRKSYISDIHENAITSGFTITGEGELPCTYSLVPSKPTASYMMSIKLQWEVGDSIPGVCVFSADKQECLNYELFFSSDGYYGDVDIDIPFVISPNDRITVILYSISPLDMTVNEFNFRNVDVSYYLVDQRTQRVEVSSSITNQQVLLEEGEEYSVLIPYVNSKESYQYLSSQNEHKIWQPSISKTEGIKYSWDNGLVQEVDNNFASQYRDLFLVEERSKYLVHWESSVLNNIPGHICLLYQGDNTCWYQNIMADTLDYSNTDIITIPASENKLQVSFDSKSYSDISINRLENFSIMKLPEQWNDIQYSPQTVKEYSEYELGAEGILSKMSIYSSDLEDKVFGKTLVTIPQASSDGWVAIASSDEGRTVLGDEYKVILKGWKQGWDISDLNINKITVIFWPNLLGYMGYIIILIVFIITFLNLLKPTKLKRNER